VPEGEKAMNRKNLIILFIAVLFLVGACSLSSRSTQAVPQTSSPQGSPSQLETATQPPLFGGNAQGGSSPDIQKTFPVPPDSQMSSPDNYDPDATSGSFTIQSQSTPDAMNKFYADQLPALGWTLRYSDANFTGGVNQYWKKDDIYLSLNIGFDEGQLKIQCEYNLVEAQAAQKLPKGFPLPGQFEMVQAGDTSWEFYIPQDYTAVTNFYTQKLSAMNWKEEPPPAPMEGEGDNSGSSKTWPAGAMPTATIDYRPENQLSFSMPDGNVVELHISPHQNGTILYVDLTMKNIASAGLPQDVPIYPGATVQIITPGNASFLVNADLKTIENYYIDQLKAAGWSPDGNPFEMSGTYNQNWVKGDQKITIALVTSDTNTMLMIDCETCNP
jgi:hypothetical protein